MPKGTYDITAIIKIFADIYGAGFGWWLMGMVAFIFSLIIILFVLKKKGLFKNAVETKLDDIVKFNNEMKVGYVESFTKIYDLQNQMNRSMHSKLKVDEVHNLVTMQNFIYKYRIVEAMIELMQVSFSIDSPDDMQLKIKEYVENIILEEDDRFYKFPNTEGAMWDSEQKFHTIVDAGLYTSIYSLMQKHSTDCNAFRKNCSNLISNFIVRNWISR